MIQFLPSSAHISRTGGVLRVSVAMANFNYGGYLADAIDSALAQTIPPFEVVVVDDGSTDESREALDGFRDRITVVLTENRGQASAINTAIAQCTGDIVCLLDSDDLMLPHRVERLIDAYASHPECQWVFHGLDFIDRRTQEPLSTPARPSFLPGFHDERRWVRLGWISMNAPATSALSWRTPFLKSLLPIPPLVRFADMYLKFASLAEAPGWVQGEALSLQGIHDSNMYTTSTGPDRQFLSLANGVAMAPGLDGLGLHMLSERLVSDALVRARFGRQLPEDQRKVLANWFGGLSYIRRARLAGISIAVGADSTLAMIRARLLPFIKRMRVSGSNEP